MNKQIIGALVVGAATLLGAQLVAGTANAGEMNVVTDNPFNGVYLGIHAGYTQADTDESFYGWADAYNSDFYGLDSWGSFTNKLTGGSLGGQVGVNYVLGTGLVIGGEVSVDWANIQGSTTDFTINGSYYCDCTIAGGEFSSTINSLGSAELKIGYATDMFMIYGTAGLALANIEWSDSIGGSVSDSGPWDLTASASGTRRGYTIGVGGAVMVMPDVAVNLQYNYTNYGSVDVSSEGTLTTDEAEPSYTYDGGFDKTVQLTSHTFKIGINKFF